MLVWVSLAIGLIRVHELVRAVVRVISNVLDVQFVGVGLVGVGLDQALFHAACMLVLRDVIRVVDELVEKSVVKGCVVWNVSRGASVKRESDPLPLVCILAVFVDACVITLPPCDQRETFCSDGSERSTEKHPSVSGQTYPGSSRT